jgi:sugar/nucleoside kinase (ribokinase family)
MADGANGAFAVDSAGVHHLAAFPLERLVDTSGAGDAFAAGFLFALINGEKPEWALAKGVSCASDVLQAASARPEWSRRDWTYAAAQLEDWQVAYGLVPQQVLYDHRSGAGMAL